MDKHTFVLRPDALYSFSAESVGHWGIFWPLVKPFLSSFQIGCPVVRLDVNLLRDEGASITDTEFSFELICPQGYAHTVRLVWFWGILGSCYLGLSSVVQKGRFFRLHVSSQDPGSYLLAVIAQEHLRHRIRKGSLVDWMSGRKEVGL